MASKLVCWQCGELLRGVPKPITRFTRCPVCRADLHVCRLCKHYDPGILGECRHERAERVLDKEQANFCTYFRPKLGAHSAKTSTAEDSSRAALEALFGLENEDEGASEAAKDPKAAAKRARKELDTLFDLDKDPDSQDEESSC